MGTIADGVRTALEYVTDAESTAVLDMVKGAHVGLSGERVQFPNKGPAPEGVGGCIWGLQGAFLRACKRIDDDEQREYALGWLVDNVHDSVDLYWRCMAIGGTPTDEACTLVNGVVKNPRNDVLRHFSIAGVVDCALDGEMRSLGLDAARVQAAAVNHGDWLLTVNWPGKRRETHRMGLPLLDLVAIYELTGDRKYLAAASMLLNWGWNLQDRRTAAEVTAGNGTKTEFRSWDSGYPWEDRGFVAGDLTDYPWYQGDCGPAFLRFWPHAHKADQGLMTAVVMAHTDWYTERNHVPEMVGVDGITPDVYRGVRNTPFHGWKPGDYEDGWHRGDLPHPHELARIWARMDDQTAYWPMRMLYWHEVDGRYWDTDHTAVGEPDVDRKRHKPWSPRLAWDWKNFPDLMRARYLITKAEGDRLLSIAAAYDYKAFADYQGGRALKKAQANPRWWNGAFGRARGLAWRLVAGFNVIEAETRD